jgi:hypothetical protein
MKKTYLLTPLLVVGLAACTATPAVQPVSLVPAATTSPADPKLDALMGVLSTSSSSALRSLPKDKAKQLATTVCHAGPTVNSQVLTLDQMAIDGTLAMSTTDMVDFVHLVNANYC